MLEIANRGFLATIQDSGRYGYRNYGVSISGAMDNYAFRVSNILVGNPEDSALIEITGGFNFSLLADTEILVAITGGDLSAKVNKEPIPMWAPVVLRKNENITFGAPKSGFRAYFAVKGGIEIPPVMNSRSTTVKGAFGGTGGPLKSGDRLHVGSESAAVKVQLKPLPERYIPEYKTNARLFVVLGPQQDYFGPEALELFLQSEYSILPQSDRQGYRLTGPVVKHAKGYDVITEAVWPGAIQIPGDGLPIILLADAQTTGGYPKIGSVISVDLDKIGQAKPSDKFVFQSINLAEAHRLFLKKEEIIKEIQAIFLR